LIDANALVDEIDGIYKRHYANSAYQFIHDFFRAVFRRIHKAPTVDAVEVVHGEWEVIEDDYFDLVEMKCSVCGVSYGFEDYEDDTPKNYHYCPNCGAKMDGDGNE
jgi:thiaminase